LLRAHGHEVLTVTTGSEALASLKPGIGAVLLGFRLPDMNGLTLLRRLRMVDPRCPIMMMSDDSSVDQTAEAMRMGSADYVTKPLCLERVLGWVERSVAPAPVTAAASTGPLDVFIGQSTAMQQVRRLLQRVACSPATTVLVTGESGTGKGIAARALHDLSPRSQACFTKVTCTAWTPNSLASEDGTRSPFAFSEGGTIFLDEIGDMVPEVQAKLLRVVEDRILPEGAYGGQPNVRLVAATHRDLRRAVAEQRFREDLYYRLSTVVVYMPPLRERPEDIAPLVEKFAQEFGALATHGPHRITPEALGLLRSHSWPGNVRELRNVVERAILLSDTGRLGVESFDLLTAPSPSPEDHQGALELPPTGLDLRKFEACMVRQALLRTGGNITRAAALLGLSRDQMRYRVDKLGLSRRDAAARAQ
jgi:DNA-binding NtrC family response regulator